MARRKKLVIELRDPRPDRTSIKLEVDPDKVNANHCALLDEMKRALSQAWDKYHTAA